MNPSSSMHSKQAKLRTPECVTGTEQYIPEVALMALFSLINSVNCDRKSGAGPGRRNGPAAAASYEQPKDEAIKTQITDMQNHFEAFRIGDVETCKFYFCLEDDIHQAMHNQFVEAFGLPAYSPAAHEHDRDKAIVKVLPDVAILREVNEDTEGNLNGIMYTAYHCSEPGSPVNQTQGYHHDDSYLVA